MVHHLVTGGIALAHGTVAGILIAHPVGLVAGGLVCAGIDSMNYLSTKGTITYLKFKGNYSSIVENNKKDAMLEFQSAIAKRLAKFYIRASDVKVVHVGKGCIWIGL